MTTSLVGTEIVLGFDIGAVNTRAILFDVVDGQYCFLASGVAPSTVEEPFFDPSEGMTRAAREVQEVTGHNLLDSEDRLILPAQPDGSGADRMVITFSAGMPVRIVVAGLLADVSLESAQRLATSTYSQVIESIGLNDRRRPEAQLDAVLKAGPDLILFAGGTEGGASRSVGRLVDLLTLVCRVLPTEKRPEVIYAGNQSLAGKVKEALDRYSTLRSVSNIRPSFDLEDLGPAEGAVAQAVSRIRQRQLPGLASIATLASVAPLPTAYAAGRVIRYLSKMYDATRGVLGVDLGANHTVVAGGQAGSLDLSVSPFGMGQGAMAVLEGGSLQDVMQWMPVHVPEDVVPGFRAHHPGCAGYRAGHGPPGLAPGLGPVPGALPQPFHSIQYDRRQWGNDQPSCHAGSEHADAAGCFAAGGPHRAGHGSKRTDPRPGRHCRIFTTPAHSGYRFWGLYAPGYRHCPAQRGALRHPHPRGPREAREWQ
jgi:hypothetical protein